MVWLTSSDATSCGHGAVYARSPCCKNALRASAAKGSAHGGGTSGTLRRDIRPVAITIAQAYSAPIRAARETRRSPAACWLWMADPPTTISPRPPPQGESQNIGDTVSLDDLIWRREPIGPDLDYNEIAALLDEVVRLRLLVSGYGKDFQLLVEPTKRRTAMWEESVKDTRQRGKTQSIGGSTTAEAKRGKEAKASARSQQSACTLAFADRGDRRSVGCPPTRGPPSQRA